jgi:hypothetical protein
LKQQKSPANGAFAGAEHLRDGLKIKLFESRSTNRLMKHPIVIKTNHACCLKSFGIKKCTALELAAERYTRK